MIKLKPHQVKAITAIEKEFSSGVMRTLAVLATGAGKTVIYLSLVDKWVKQGKRVLILAHRRELIHQPVDRALEFFPDLSKKMGIVMANIDEAAEQVTVATVQTANARDRLADDYDYVVLDECHHGTSKSYLKLFAKYPKARWLGLTATPFRTDGSNMSKIFDSVSIRYPITAAVEDGILVPFDAYGFTLPISIEGVSETMQGWDEKIIGSLLSADNTIEVVYEKWKEYCSDRQTICFTASVGQAHATARFFRDRGISAQAVDGSTPKRKRDGILRLFRKGKIQVVCNCQVWTEGIDVPEASAALMVCPTKSDLSYVQKLGRILRTFPGKTNALVLDFAPLEDRNVVMAGDILGTPRVEKEAVKRARKSGVLVRVAKVDQEGIPMNIDPSELVVETLQYLRKGFLAWSFQGTNAVASLSENIMMVIELPDSTRIAKAEYFESFAQWEPKHVRLLDYLKHYHVWVCRKGTRMWEADLKGWFPSIEKAMEVCNQMIDAGYRPSLAKRRKAWRSKPASEPQLRYMKQLRIENIPEKCNQGQAAQLISHEIACNAVRRIRAEFERQIMKGVI